MPPPIPPDSEQVTDMAARVDKAYTEGEAVWGVPLHSSGGDKRTRTLLAKFVTARVGNVDEAMEMLAKTIAWRKSKRLDEPGVVDKFYESGKDDYHTISYYHGVDKDGHPVCYNRYCTLREAPVATKGTEDEVERFLHWRISAMERGIRQLDLDPDSTRPKQIMLVHDLSGAESLMTSPTLLRHLPTVMGTLNENYPEFTCRSVFINCSLLAQGVFSIINRIVSQRQRDKFVTGGSGNDALLTFVDTAQLPALYGGPEPPISTDGGSETEAVAAAPAAP